MFEKVEQNSILSEIKYFSIQIVMMGTYSTSSPVWAILWAKMAKFSKNEEGQVGLLAHIFIFVEGFFFFYGVAV